MIARVPPHSLEHERALLACVLIDGAITFGLVDGIVRHDDFYAQVHQTIWKALGSANARNQPLDQLTLRDELAQAGKLAAVGGDEFLLSLTDTIPASEHAEAYARRIVELATVRRIISVCHDVASRGYALEGDAKAYVEQAESAILGCVRDSAVGVGLVHIGVSLRQTFERIQRLAAEKKQGVTGLPTGITALDRMMTGLHPGDLIIVAGRPGMGKSAFMTRLILSAASRPEGLTACFSLEMQSEMVAARLVAADADVDLRAMRAAQITADMMGQIVRAVGAIDGMPIYVDETPGLSIAAVRSRARRLRAQGPVALIVVDYVQLMRGTNSRDSREQQISETTRGLKELAKELGCPVVALSQLNRDCEKRPDKRPQLADLRESGAIEQDADAVILLYRRGYYAAQAAKNKPDPRAPKSDIAPGEDDGVTELILAKQRNGPPGVVECLFRDTSANFVNLERDYDGDDGEPYGQAHWSNGDEA